MGFPVFISTGNVDYNNDSLPHRNIMQEIMTDSIGRGVNNDDGNGGRMF